MLDDHNRCRHAGLSSFGRMDDRTFIEYNRPVEYLAANGSWQAGLFQQLMKGRYEYDVRGAMIGDKSLTSD